MSSHVTGNLLLVLALALFSLTSQSELSPYPQSKHGSPRSHRYVRECHETQNTTETFVIKDPNTTGPPLTVKTFEDDIPQSIPHRFAYGHMAVISNPLDTFSVYEPDSEGSCTSQPNTTQHFLTDSARAHNCIYATNGGFFDVKNGNCLGNMWSDGRLVVNGNGKMNPNFGILENGKIVVGYLTEEHILDLKWRNLVQGIIWLVRDGKNYVDEAIKMECDDMQATGQMEYFVSTNSARTAIGYDKQGNVVLLHVEGKTGSPRGINLREFADLLIDHGLVNAINLDGGSSSTVTYNDTVINYPSSHCEDDNGAYRCQHLISSLLCVHASCKCVHGTCNNNMCTCNPGYTGPTCEERLECANNCSDHGTCASDGCHCETGWVGNACHVACPDGYYGNQCKLACTCTQGKCNHVTGKCTCFPGWTGDTCGSACPNQTWGQDCNKTCTNCTLHGSCDPQTGECLCSLGWQGKICQIYRGTSQYISGLNTRVLGILCVLIGLVALCLISLSFNVYFYLKSRSRQSYKPLRTSSSRSARSPRLPAADITAKEHVQRQIPIYREIQEISNRKNGPNSNVFRMEIRGSTEVTEQSKDVLQMIEKIEIEEESLSDIDDTALLLKRQ